MVKIKKSFLYFSAYIVCIFPIITLIFSVIYTNTPYLTGILTELGQSLNDFPSLALSITKLTFFFSNK